MTLTFDRILGQPRVVAALTAAIESERLSQAVLFHGPSGVGKTTTALVVAAALNCEASPKKRPCGTCLSCRKTATFNHPDVHVVVPLFPAALWKEEAGAGSADEPGESPLCRLYHDWSQDPFYVFQWPKRPSIATEWILEIKREASKKTFEGRTKVILMSNVEALGVEAANRILKMLEEPGPNTVFLLTTSRVHHVLPTIRSRCQRYAFGELPIDVISGILTKHFSMKAKDALRLAGLARGSLSRAVLLKEEGILDVREWVLSVLALDDDARIDRLNEDVLANARTWDVSRVRHVTEVLMTWYQDVLSIKHGRAETELANRDHVAAIRKEADALTVEDIGRRVREVDGLVATVEGQVTPSLALFSMFARLSANGEQLLLGGR